MDGPRPGGARRRLRSKRLRAAHPPDSETLRFEQQRDARPSRRAEEVPTDRQRSRRLIYPAKAPNAPIFVFVHGGAWRSGVAKDYAYPAEIFVNAGANYIALDFIDVGTARRPPRWPIRSGAVCLGYKNAASSAAMPTASISAAIPRAGISAVSRW